MKKSDPKAGIVFHLVTQVAAGRSVTVQVLPSQTPPATPTTQVSTRPLSHPQRDEYTCVTLFVSSFYSHSTPIELILKERMK